METENLLGSGGIEVSPGTGRAVVRLWGDVDASLRDEASNAMVELLARGGPYVADVSGVTFLDSSGIAFLLQLHRVAADEGSRLILRDPPVLVIDLLQLIGIADVIPLEFTNDGPAASAAAVPDSAAEIISVAEGGPREVVPATDGDGVAGLTSSTV